MRRATAWLACAGVVCAAQLANGESLTIVSYNVESGGASAATVAAEIEKLPGVDVWGFSELASEAWLATFELAAEQASRAPFGTILGTTGKSTSVGRDADLLGVLYREDLLERLGQSELHSINDWGHRAPLVAEFRLHPTATRFLLVLNHLASKDAGLRLQQSHQLREWALFREAPLVMIGDFNYRWRIGESERDHPPGFDALTRDRVLQWVRPAKLRATWCGGKQDSVLDFAFVNAAANRWNPSADVIETACTKSSQLVSDHRPVRVSSDLP
jgi:endonuclease/exonuclease/phosphatase family metal-dependent hydrolase